MTSLSPPQARPVSTHRVLLVDDDPNFMQLLKEFFVAKREPSWIVHIATDYSEVLECLKLHAVDLIVLDLQMPVMDGLQLLTLLRRSHPGLPVVVLSGYVTQEKRDFALQNGASLVLEKMELAAGFDRIFPALEAAAEAPAAGFKGVLRQVGLMELLQMECLGRKSSILDIKAPNSHGRVYISEGAIVHAECDHWFGEKALAQILRLTGGEFRLAPYAPPMRQTISGHWEGLLMEAAQTSDEQAGEEAAQSKAVEKPPETERTLDRRIEEIVVVSASNDVLYQWKAKDADRRVRLVNLLLVKSGDLGKIVPALGHPDRFEINEPTSRVICFFQQESRFFIRLSVTPSPL